MGIRPWVDKKSLVRNEPVVNNYKLLILTQADLAPKEQSLLMQIISFVGLDEQCFKHSAKLTADLSADYVLAFGDVGPYNLTSIVETESLNEVLHNPLLKKKLFQLLVSLKSKLAA